LKIEQLQLLAKLGYLYNKKNMHILSNEPFWDHLYDFVTPKAAAKLKHVITKLHQTHNIDCYDFGHTKAAAFV
jgi:hypothetical protein